MPFSNIVDCAITPLQHKSNGRVSIPVILLSLLALTGLHMPASAEPGASRTAATAGQNTSTGEDADTTRLMVRVRSVDAKFIGSGVGGMNVVIENAASGELLDSGRISGATGDTDALMQQGQSRGRSPAGGGTAGVLARLAIDQPTRVRISLAGPLQVEHSIQQLEVTTWIVPGRHITDPGIVLTLPGLIVDLARAEVEDGSVRIAADVTLMCGCPITGGGLWDATGYEVVAQLRQDDLLVAEAPLDFTGATNRFAGELSAPENGEYQLWVYAHAAKTGNTGVAKQPLTIE